MPLALRAGACWLALAAASGCGGRAADRVDLGRPPIVLIVLDALHAKHLTHLGNARPTTPNLDALAAEGVSFPAAFAPSPYTLASVPSILTGRLPASHGVVDKKARLAEDEVTLAELLAAVGYRTAGAVGNLNGSSLFACDQGFEEFVEVFRAEDGRSVDVVSGRDRFHFARAVDFPPLVDRFLDADDGRPPFLYLHILEPHEPYVPPESFRRLYLDPDYAGPFRQGDSRTLIQGRTGKLPFTAEDKAAIEALYDANLTHVDDVVGQILARLDAAGILDETLVLVTSDHGEAFWQHGVQGHNTMLFDEMLLVPLIVRFPKGKGPARGLRPAALVSPMDVLPSLCEWLDLALPPNALDGASLTGAMAGSADLARALPFRTSHAEPLLGLRTLESKTVVQFGANGEPERVEHYRLVEDPQEMRDAADRFPTAVEADLKRLRELRERSLRARSERGVPLSAADEAMLEHLGYAGDE